MMKYLQASKEQFIKGDYLLALEFCQAALAENPDSLDAMLLLADCYAKMGQINQAKAIVFRILSNDPCNKLASERLDSLIDDKSHDHLREDASKSTSTNTVMSSTHRLNTSCSADTKNHSITNAEHLGCAIVSFIIGGLVLLCGIFTEEIGMIICGALLVLCSVIGPIVSVDFWE